VQLLSSLLAGGESSRLYRDLVIGGLAQDVSADQMPTKYGSLFVISATANEDVTIAQMESAINAELRQVVVTPASASEMERLHNQFEFGFLDGLQSLQNRAVQLNQYWAYTGSPDYLAKDLARFRDATAEGLRDVVNPRTEGGK
jgi:zinc protease